MYGCESWTIKKAKCWWTDAFKLWFWIRLLRVPWTARKSKQSILKEINPEYSLEADAEAPILWPPDVKSWLIGEDLMLGKIEGRRRRGRQRWDGWMASPTRPTWVWASSGRWWRAWKPGVLQSTGSQRVGHDWATEQRDWDKLGNLSQSTEHKLSR